MTMRADLRCLGPSKAMHKRLESLAFELRSVPTAGHSFSQMLVAHVEQLISVPNRVKKGFLDGTDFSCLFVDALLQHGVRPDQILTEVRCKKYVAEIDVLVTHGVNDATAFHLKTSTRERWRQAERDCIYFTDRFTNAMELALGADKASAIKRTSHYVLMVREYKDTTPKEAVEFCRRRDGSYAFLEGFLTIYDTERLDQIVRKFVL